MSRHGLIVRICVASVLAVLSVLFQALPPIILVPWGMRVDLVAVPWIVCWMLLDLRAALLSMLISIPFVGYVGLSGGWIGAVMKSIASIWMFLIPGIASIKLGKERVLSKKLFFSIGCVSIIARDFATVFLNLYFAIPLFFHLTPSQVIEYFTNPRLQSSLTRTLGLTGFLAYFSEIVFWNSLQGVIDLVVSILIFKAVIRYGLLRLKAYL